MASRAVPRTTPAIPATQTSSSSIKFLMSPTIVTGVISTIMKQAYIVMFQVKQPLATLVNQVVGGVWKGDGATRFVEEMNSVVNAQLDNLEKSIGDYGWQVTNAKERMLNADNQAGKVASGLMDEFKGVYH